MELKVIFTKQFKKDLKLAQKQNKNIKKLKNTILRITKRETLPRSFKDHALKGDYNGFRECHIEPDWLLIYQIDEDSITLTAARTGTHSALF